MTRPAADKAAADTADTDVRTDKRLIVSFPKSGRTWLRFALVESGIDATFSHAGHGTRSDEIGHRFSGIPEKLAHVPLVFLHRDPIDTAVSMFYQVHRRELRPGTFRRLKMLVRLARRGAAPPRRINDFVTHPLYGVELICAFNRAWLDHLAGRKDCLVLTYEAMRADPVSGFQSLIDYFGIRDVTGADLAAASDFDRMKKIEKTGEGIKSLRPGSASDPLSFKVRRGKVGGYTDELTPQTVARCKEIMARYGFSVSD